MVLISGPGTPFPCALQVSQGPGFTFSQDLGQQSQWWEGEGPTHPTVKNGVIIPPTLPPSLHQLTLSKELSVSPLLGVYLRKVLEMQIAHLRQRLRGFA